MDDPIDMFQGDEFQEFMKDMRKMFMDFAKEIHVITKNRDVVEEDEEAVELEVEDEAEVQLNQFSLKPTPTDHAEEFETVVAEVPRSRVAGETEKMEEPEAGEVQILLTSGEDPEMVSKQQISQKSTPSKNAEDEDVAKEEEDMPNPSFAFSWLDGRDTFLAGNVANIKVKLLGDYKRDNFKIPFKPNITVHGKMGNSSLISGISLNSNDDPIEWKFSFIPIIVGLYNVLITDDNFNVLDSSLHFRVSPGKIYPTACIVSWMDQINEFAEGSNATFLMHSQDAFGNNVSQHRQGPSPLNLTMSTSSENDSVAVVLNLTYKEWNELGFLIFEKKMASLLNNTNVMEVHNKDGASLLELSKIYVDNRHLHILRNDYRHLVGSVLQEEGNCDDAKEEEDEGGGE